MEVTVHGVGICGPGLGGWAKSSRILVGLEPYEFEPLPRASSTLLPAAERRRSSESARIAVEVGLEAMHHGGFSLDSVATVFASSDGDGQIIHLICEALASNPRDVSPTRFHNSVHNAAAGYWSIAAQSQQPSTSLCAFNASFAAGLLDAASQIVVDRQPVLLIAFDLPFPSPLAAVHCVDNGFAAAILMAPDQAPCCFSRQALARWKIELRPGGTPTPPPPELADSLRSNPAARCLPLLAMLAKQQAIPVAGCVAANFAAQSVCLEYLDDHVLVIESVQ